MVSYGRLTMILLALFIPRVMTSSSLLEDRPAKDKSEKSFTVNIYKTNGPGKYNFVKGNPTLSVAQMGNWVKKNICVVL